MPTDPVPPSPSSQPAPSAAVPAMVHLNELAIAVNTLTSSQLKLLLGAGAQGIDISKVAACACQGRDCGCDGVFCGCDTRRNDPADLVSFPEMLVQREATIASLQKQLAALQKAPKQKASK